MSLGIGVFTGVVAGLILTCIYSSESAEFFNDSPHFDVPEVTVRIKTTELTQDNLIEPRG